MIVWLEIDNWTGLSLGAVHYYGTLRYGDEKRELWHPMSTEEAAYENRKEIAGGGRPLSQPGGTSRAFLRLEDLRDFAVRDFALNTLQENHFPAPLPARLLVEGRNRLYPGPVLFGPPDVKGAAQVLTDRMEALYGNRSEPRSWAEHDAILDEWQALIAPFQ